MAMMSAAPALAAPDRNICEDAAAATLDVATTEFSQEAAADAGESIELLGPNFELASRERAVGEGDTPEQSERGVGEDSDGDEINSAVPADAGPLVYKRRMYRRDI
jgi:hypothetical protein